MSTVPVSASESSERHASWLELFFDLVYVFAVAQLDAGLVDHADVAGGLVCVALFVRCGGRGWASRSTSRGFGERTGCTGC